MLTALISLVIVGCRATLRQISPVSALLPCSENLQFAVSTPVEAYGGCYNWEVQKPNLVEILPIDDALNGNELSTFLRENHNFSSSVHQKCSSKVLARPASKVSCSERLQSWLFAYDTMSQKTLKTEIYLAPIDHIEIVTKARRVLVNGFESLYVVAYDAFGNQFTSLEGLAFEWFIDNDTALERASLTDDIYKPTLVRAAIEKNGLTGDTILIKGKSSGTSNITVKYVGPTNTLSASVEMNVTETFSIFPNDLTTVIGSNFELVLEPAFNSTYTRDRFQSFFYFDLTDCKKILKQGYRTNEFEAIGEGSCTISAIDKRLAVNIEHATINVISPKNIRLRTVDANIALGEYGSSKLEDIFYDSDPKIAHHNQQLAISRAKALSDAEDSLVLPLRTKQLLLFDIIDETENKPVYISKSLLIDFIDVPDDIDILETTNNGAFAIILAKSLDASNKLNGVLRLNENFTFSETYRVIRPLFISHEADDITAHNSIIIPSELLRRSEIKLGERNFFCKTKKPRCISQTQGAVSNTVTITDFTPVLLPNDIVDVFVHGGSGYISGYSSDDDVCEIVIDNDSRSYKLVTKDRVGFSIITVVDQRYRNLTTSFICANINKAVLELEAPDRIEIKHDQKTENKVKLFLAINANDFPETIISYMRKLRNSRSMRLLSCVKLRDQLALTKLQTKLEVTLVPFKEYINNAICTEYNVSSPNSSGVYRIDAKVQLMDTSLTASGIIDFYPTFSCRLKSNPFTSIASKFISYNYLSNENRANKPPTITSDALNRAYTIGVGNKMHFNLTGGPTRLKDCQYTIDVKSVSHISHQINQDTATLTCHKELIASPVDVVLNEVCGNQKASFTYSMAINCSYIYSIRVKSLDSEVNEDFTITSIEDNNNLLLLSHGSPRTKDFLKSVTSIAYPQGTMYGYNNSNKFVALFYDFYGNLILTPPSYQVHWIAAYKTCKQAELSYIDELDESGITVSVRPECQKDSYTLTAFIVLKSFKLDTKLSSFIEKVLTTSENDKSTWQQEKKHYYLSSFINYKYKLPLKITKAPEDSVIIQSNSVLYRLDLDNVSSSMVVDSRSALLSLVPTPESSAVTVQLNMGDPNLDPSSDKSDNELFKHQSVFFKVKEGQFDSTIVIEAKEKAYINSTNVPVTVTFDTIRPPMIKLNLEQDGLTFAANKPSYDVESNVMIIINANFDTNAKLNSAIIRSLPFNFSFSDSSKLKILSQTNSSVTFIVNSPGKLTVDVAHPLAKKRNNLELLVHPEHKLSPSDLVLVSQMSSFIPKVEGGSHETITPISLPWDGNNILSYERVAKHLELADSTNSVRIDETNLGKNKITALQSGKATVVLSSNQKNKKMSVTVAEPNDFALNINGKLFTVGSPMVITPSSINRVQIDLLLANDHSGYLKFDKLAITYDSNYGCFYDIIPSSNNGEPAVLFVKQKTADGVYIVSEKLNALHISEDAYFIALNTFVKPESLNVRVYCSYPNKFLFEHISDIMSRKLIKKSVDVNLTPSENGFYAVPSTITVLYNHSNHDVLSVLHSTDSEDDSANSAINNFIYVHKLQSLSKLLLAFDRVDISQVFDNFDLWKIQYKMYPQLNKLMLLPNSLYELSDQFELISSDLEASNLPAVDSATRLLNSNLINNTHSSYLRDTLSNSIYNITVGIPAMINATPIFIERKGTTSLYLVSLIALSTDGSLTLLQKHSIELVNPNPTKIAVKAHSAHLYSIYIDEVSLEHRFISFKFNGMETTVPLVHNISSSNTLTHDRDNSSAQTKLFEKLVDALFTIMLPLAISLSLLGMAYYLVFRKKQFGPSNRIDQTKSIKKNLSTNYYPAASRRKYYFPSLA